VIADFMESASISREYLVSVGYSYDSATDKWNIGDAAADYLYTADKLLDFALPGTLKVICNYKVWLTAADKSKYFPLYTVEEYLSDVTKSQEANFISVDANSKQLSFSNGTEDVNKFLNAIQKDATAVLCLWSSHKLAMASVRQFVVELLY
jgi:(E)-4-hydroxy-3-methylbut-2-enyl-diphosphate synthase